MTDTFLSFKEIQALTQRKVRTAQVRVLKAMGIEHRVRPDGSVAILRSHITKLENHFTEHDLRAKVASDAGSLEHA